MQHPQKTYGPEPCSITCGTIDNFRTSRELVHHCVGCKFLSGCILRSTNGRYTLSSPPTVAPERTRDGERVPARCVAWREILHVPNVYFASGTHLRGPIVREEELGAVDDDAVLMPVLLESSVDCAWSRGVFGAIVDPAYWLVPDEGDKVFPEADSRLGGHEGVRWRIRR